MSKPQTKTGLSLLVDQASARYDELQLSKPKLITITEVCKPSSREGSINLLKRCLLQIKESSSMQGLLIPIEFSNGEFAEYIILKISDDEGVDNNLAFYFSKPQVGSKKFFEQLFQASRSLEISGSVKLTNFDLSKSDKTTLKKVFIPLLELLENLYKEHHFDLYTKVFSVTKEDIDRIIEDPSSYIKAEQTIGSAVKDAYQKMLERYEYKQALFEVISEKNPDKDLQLEGKKSLPPFSTSKDRPRIVTRRKRRLDIQAGAAEDGDEASPFQAFSGAAIASEEMQITAIVAETDSQTDKKESSKQSIVSYGASEGGVEGDNHQKPLTRVLRPRTR